ncbi:MAG: hypothetical protein N2595_07805 [bacterium]|nr:hypothetical protein [bacterium]
MRTHQLLLVLCGCVGLANCGRREDTPATVQHNRPPTSEFQALQADVTPMATAVLEHAVFVFEQALSTMTGDTGAEGVSPAAWHALLTNLSTDQAVTAAVQAVICNWCRNYTAAYDVVSALLQRPLTLWQSNTVHQPLCMLNMRTRNFDAVIAYIARLSPASFTDDTPKAIELLRLLETACRAIGDDAGARAALELQVQHAKHRGTHSVVSQYVLARHTREQGQPWTHVNPELAAFEQELQHQYSSKRAQVREEVSRMTVERRAEFIRRYEAFQSSPHVPLKSKIAVSNQIFDMLYP